MLSSQARELKAAGAIEAAQDPHSEVTSDDAQKTMIAESKKGGGAAFQFDPDATPEQKAAQARANVPPGFHHEKKPTAQGVVSDADDSAAPKYDLPPATADGAVPLPTGDGKANGQVPEDARWAKDRVGWEPRFGPGDPADDEGPTLADHQTWVESKLDDKWFGDWYYNAGVVIFACLSTYVVVILGGGLAWVFIIMAICSTYYRTSLRRVRRNYRDDVTREMAKARLETDHESLEWINSFLVKFWPIYAPVLCDTIINSVDQVLSTSTPAFLDSLRLKTFVLGTKPPRLEHVKTYPKTEEDIVLMDWKFSFNPNDVADLTTRQLKNKINPKVVLEVRVGKGVISKGLDIIVEDMAFSGLMRVKIKLQIAFPHIERAEICFLQRPDIDYVCKPLGGDTFGFDINVVPGLEGFIQEQIHGNLAPIMYAPNVFPIEIAKMLSGSAVDQAIGVVQVTLQGAQGLKNPDKFPGVPDPYTTISINGRDTLGKSKTVMENANPRWNETFNVIVTNLKENLTMKCFDFNEFRKDKELGTATFALDRLEAEIVHENLMLEVMSGGKARGAVQADIRFFPVLEGAKLDDGSTQPPPESNTGIVKFTVEQAKDLDGSKSMIGQLSPYALLMLNGRDVQTSQIIKRTNQPIWPNAHKEMLITDRKTAKLGVVIKDDRGLATDPIIGTYQVKLDDMVNLMAKGQEWYNLAGAKTGRVKMMVEWKPVALKGGAAGSGGYIKPIGVMRLHFINARDLRNLETVGKSDPYVRVLLSGIEKGRTVTFQNDLNPDFDEVIYVPMHSEREKLTLEVMDQESVGKDRSLGSLELAASEYIHEGDDGEYLVHEVKEPRAGKLQTSARGSAKDPEEEQEKTEVNGVAGSNSAGATPRSSLDRAGAFSSAMSSKTNGKADMAKQLADGEKEQEETPDVNAKEAPKIKLTADDLVNYESGLLVFKLLNANLASSNCYFEVMIDDMLFPSWSSSRVRTRQTELNETGDVMVRELDVSKITLRLNEKHDGKGQGTDESITAKLQGDTIDVLKRGLYQTLPLTLRGTDGRESKIKVYLKYLPVKMQLDASESINNQGTLRVEVLDAADLPAADRNGFSDPYCKFILNDKQVYKTETQKKTLHPAWNEFFEVPIKSRTASKFKVDVFDWDFRDSDDHLGTADINLEALHPYEAQETSLGLDGKSGSIRLKLLFKPDFVTRARQGSSTFHGTFATPGKVIGAPVKGVGKGAVFLGGGIVKGASFMGRGFRRHKSDKSTGGDDRPTTMESSNGINGAPDSPRVLVDGQEPNTPTRARSISEKASPSPRPALAMSASPGMSGEQGTASFTILSVAGFDGSHIRVIVQQHTAKGSVREVHKTKAVKSTGTDVSYSDQNENFRVPCTADTQFTLQVKDAHTFGSDVDLGQGTVFVADGNGADGAEKTVKVGEGSVVLRSSFTPVDAASSVSSPARKDRRSFMGARSSRAVTPAAE